jgi:prevent-host-death family protein
LALRLDVSTDHLYSSNSRKVQFMPTSAVRKRDPLVVSALHARSNFGRLLRRVDVERRSLVIEKRGTPTAVLLSLQDYVKLAAPEPEVLKIIGDEATKSRTNALSSRRIDEIVKAARAAKKNR